jgi:hypothetical protein
MKNAVSPVKSEGNPILMASDITSSLVTWRFQHQRLANSILYSSCVAVAVTVRLFGSFLGLKKMAGLFKLSSLSRSKNSLYTHQDGH